MQGICFFLFNFDSCSMRSLSQVLLWYQIAMIKSCLNFSLTYFFFRTAKHILHHFCLDMLMWYRISVPSWGRDTKLTDWNGFQQVWCRDDGTGVGQWLSLSVPFTCLKMSIHFSNVLLLSWGGLSQDTSRSTYPTLSDLAVCAAPFFKLAWFPSFPHMKDGALSKIFHLTFHL